MSERDTVGRIEQLTEEVRQDLEARHGVFAKLSPEFERRVAAEVQRRRVAELPQCWKCRFWAGTPGVDISGECTRRQEDSLAAGFYVLPEDAEVRVITANGFGCVQWEGRTDGDDVMTREEFRREVFGEGEEAADG